jgi:RNA binding exosome subunit
LKARFAEVSFHIHSTEDWEKVGGALKETLGVEAKEGETLYGHNGNVILSIRSSLGAQEAESLFVKVLGGFSSADRVRLLEELEKHLDERGSFHVRLDKQELVLRRISLGESDSIKLSFRLAAKGEMAVGMIRECLT